MMKNREPPLTTSGDQNTSPKVIHRLSTGTYDLDTIQKTNQPQQTTPPTHTEPPMPIQRPCLTCNKLTTNPRRCPTCHHHHTTTSRLHYRGNYKRRAKQITDNATTCHLCGQGPRPNDPWTADHVTPGDTSPTAPLLPAHRSCNSSRQAKPIPGAM